MSRSALNTHRFPKPAMVVQACNARAQEGEQNCEWEASLGSRDPRQQRQAGP